MGGDNAPKCTAEGAIEALRADSDLRITLGGDAAQLTPLLMDCDDVRERITVEHTTQVITNHDSPVMAVRTMKAKQTALCPPVPPARCWPRACSAWVAWMALTAPPWPR